MLVRACPCARACACVYVCVCVYVYSAPAPRGRPFVERPRAHSPLRLSAHWPAPPPCGGEPPLCPPRCKRKVALATLSRRMLASYASWRTRICAAAAAAVLASCAACRALRCSKPRTPRILRAACAFRWFFLSCSIASYTSLSNVSRVQRLFFLLVLLALTRQLPAPAPAARRLRSAAGRPPRPVGDAVGRPAQASRRLRSAAGRQPRPVLGARPPQPPPALPPSLPVLMLHQRVRLPRSAAAKVLG